MASALPQLDFNKIPFPSDQLTIKAIRSQHPELFAQREPLFFEGPAHADVSGMLMTERELAERAYGEALGQPAPIEESHEGRRELILMLDESYRTYGLSSGLKSTYELVRNFEKAAVAQAKTRPGSSLT